jgi:multiple sugar transport system substrate-binding protein
MAAYERLSMRLTRREILKWSGVLAAGTLLAACAPATQPQPTATPSTAAQPTVAPASPTPVPAPTRAPVTGKVVIMHKRHELTEDEEKQFEEATPGIQIELLADDLTRFFAMYAAGNPPDLLRVQAPGIPQYLARKILKDLTPYFETSTVLKMSDLAPANNYYKANSPLDVGQGKIYGMVKDWSPDFTLFAYKPAFEKAGLSVPDDTKPLTYDDVFQLARKLAKFEGDRTLMFGYGYGDWWIDRIIMNMMAEKGRSLYIDSFTKMDLAKNEEAVKIARYYFDLAKEKVVASPLNPSPSWNGEDFTKGTVALIQYGYWFSAMAESDVTRGQVVMLPAPTWAGVRRNPTITATGMVMAAATTVPDAAWKVFEWYNGKEPAIARAKSGWGVPGLKSLYNLMPAETDFQRQVQRVLQEEMKYADFTLQFNPFLGETTAADTWAKYLEQGLKGQITFDDMLAKVEKEVNVAIQEGVNRIA